jgi:putative membrane protein
MPYRAWLLVVVLLAVAASAVSPYDRQDWVLEHIPTALVLAFLIWYEKRAGPLSNVSYTLLAVLLLLHVLGAHHLYSRVPYDDWSEALFGRRLSAAFGATRNHYDRFVHLAFGLFALLPLAEIVQRHVTRSRAWAIVVAVAFIGVLSKVYELAEWVVALVMSPEAAENYNGQQGDPFDAQKDMALALSGSLASSPFVAARLGRQGPRATAAPGDAPPAAR